MDTFLASYDATSLYRWSRATGGSGDDIGVSVAFDPKGNTLIAGDFQGTVNIDIHILTSAGLSDIFISKYRQPWTETADLADALVILQIMTGFTPDLSTSSIQDIGNDTLIGSEELIYALRRAAGLE